MIEEMARYRCEGDDGTPITVIEHRHVFTTTDDDKVRHQRGAAWLSLPGGEPVRYIDAATFEVIRSGEVLRRM
jgi:hypothetical protein